MNKSMLSVCVGLSFFINVFFISLRHDNAYITTYKLQHFKITGMGL